jgi:hypothetical protein
VTVEAIHTFVEACVFDMAGFSPIFTLIYTTRINVRVFLKLRADTRYFDYLWSPSESNLDPTAFSVHPEPFGSHCIRASSQIKRKQAFANSSSHKINQHPAISPTRTLHYVLVASYYTHHGSRSIQMDIRHHSPPKLALALIVGVFFSAAWTRHFLRCAYRSIGC